jgi:hypothetical protein
LVLGAAAEGTPTTKFMSVAFDPLSERLDHPIHRRMLPVADFDPSIAPSLKAVVLIAQQLTGFSVDEMYPRTCLANDRLIFVGLRVFIVIQPMLNLQLCRRTSEHEASHSPSIVGGIERSGLI